MRINTMAVLAVVAAAFAAEPASAGYSNPSDFYCYTSGNYNYCRGTVSSPRATSERNDYAQFVSAYSQNGPIAYFYARHGGSYYSCSFGPEASPHIANAVSSMGDATHFYIIIRDGECNYTNLTNSSRIVSSPADP